MDGILWEEHNGYVSWQKDLQAKWMHFIQTATGHYCQCIDEKIRFTLFPEWMIATSVFVVCDMPDTGKMSKYWGAAWTN